MKKTRKFILPAVLLVGFAVWVYGLATQASWLPWVAYPLWIAIAVSMIGYVIFKRDRVRSPNVSQLGELDTPAAEQTPGNQPRNGSMIPGGGIVGSG